MALRAPSMQGSSTRSGCQKTSLRLEIPELQALTFGVRPFGRAFSAA
jgi:hypothetical protein